MVFLVLTLMMCLVVVSGTGADNLAANPAFRYILFVDIVLTAVLATPRMKELESVFWGDE